MEKIIGTLVESFNNGNWLVAAVLIGLAAAFKLKAIFEFLDERSSRQERYLRSLLSDGTLGVHARELVSEHLESLAMKKAIGISGNRFTWERIQAVVATARGELTTRDLSHVRQHLRTGADSIQIEINGFHRFERAFNLGLALLFAVAGVLMMVLLLFEPMMKHTAILLYGTGLSFVALGAVVLAQTAPLAAADRLRPILAQLQSAKGTAALKQNDRS